MKNIKPTNLPNELQERVENSALALFEALDSYGKASKIEKLLPAIQLIASFMECTPELEKAISEHLEVAKDIWKHDSKFNLKIIK